MTRATQASGPQHETAGQQLGSDSPTRPRARDTAADLSGEALHSELVELTRRLSSGTYELLVLVGELDARGTWAAWGALSCAARLADTRDIELGTARSQVRVARALTRPPAARRRDAHRRPLPTRRQRRAVDATHPECQHPGCHARTFLQHDHIHPHAQGGPTIVANLQKLCGPHNRARQPQPVS